MMKDSMVDPNWLREQMAKNPPSLRPNGNIFTGPVRLSFPDLFRPGKPSQDAGPDAEGKFGAALLFPPGTDMSLFEKTWMDVARSGLPENWSPDGKPIGIHSPFHDQAEKAYGAKPLAGYTAGAIYFSATSKYKPVIVDAQMQALVDEARVYPGVWAFCALNAYSYKNKKRGVAFGLQTVMIIMDDQKLAGGGGNPKADFGAVAITAAANVAAKFDQAPGNARSGQHAGGAGILPSGGHVGAAGSLPVHALPKTEQQIMNEMMGIDDDIPF